MLKVVFCPDGHHVSDFYACDYVDSVIYEYAIGGGADMEVRFSNETVLDAFVLRVMQDRFPMNEIEFYYKDHDMEADLQMRCDKYHALEIPDGIKRIGTRYDMTNQILKLGYEKLKADRLSEKDRKDD